MSNQRNQYSRSNKSNLCSRNLRKEDLGGVIFGCTRKTMRECLSKQLFGLPAGHFSYVKSIEPGLPLFLFNYSNRELHGIFEAASHGQMNIDPYGWTTDGSEKTQFPAQVRIFIRANCQALSEEHFKKIIHDNYYKSAHFWFELDHVQTTGLISMFESLPISSSINAIPYNPSNWRTLCCTTTNTDARHEKENPETSASKETCPDHQNSSKGATPCLEEEDKVLDSHSNREMERIYLKLKQLALGKENLNSHPKLHAEDTVDPCVMADTIEDESESAPATPSVAEDCRDVSTNSSDLDSLTNWVDSDSHLQQQSHDKFHSGYDCLVFVMGGYDGISWLSTSDCYSPSRDIVQPLMPMSLVRAYASATVLKGNIYNIGGENGNSWFDTVECYNPLSDEWTLCPPLNKKKGCLASATLHDKIYAVGGGNGIDCFSEVEMFDPALGRWILTQSMLQKRFSPAAVELNGVLYVVGGFNGSNYLKSAERLDPREVSWTKLQSMHTRRGSHSLAVLNEKLYALGGHDGSKSISSAEVFDPRIGSWIEGEEMKQPRAYSTAFVFDETIYLLGGLKDGSNIANKVMCYKEGQGWWKTNLKGIGKRCFFSASVL